MRDTFVALRDWLEAGGDPQAKPTAAFDVPQRRLLDAWTNSSRTLGPSDAAALLAHVLRREKALAPGSKATITLEGGRSPLPLGNPEHFGLAASRDGSWVQFSPTVWRPAWLPGADTHSVLEPVLREDPRRSFREVAGDPFLRLVGWQTYRCDAQREAVRALLSIPEPATVLVNLPTGAGKSLCAQLPALLRTRAHGGVAVVIVPTIALAIDQEAAIKSLLPEDCAYIGGRDEATIARNSAIRARIAKGEQRIVFTSPEGLLSGLSVSVHTAARQGLLRLLVIDEAHMVEEWGESFRPAFQELAGLRTSLLAEAPIGSAFMTVLLSATTTATVLDTLEALFGKPGPFQVIAASQLRAEPSHWVVNARDEDQRRRWVLEAINHIPRRAIVYVTRPRDAASWREHLRGLGYSRVGCLTGRTPARDRRDALEDWRLGNVDVMVATAAFGLGVDQQDVRAVIHATLPESVDRYYQEVGRAGRDGNACLSLIVSTPSDEELARTLSKRVLIGSVRGRERWSRMRRGGIVRGDARLLVPVEVAPSARIGDIDMNSRLNLQWNVKTLTLMARAGLLELDADTQDMYRAEQEDHGKSTPEQRRKRAAERDGHRLVRLLRGDTEAKEVWREHVEPLRARAAQRNRNNLRLLSELLEGDRCHGDILAEAYTIDERKSPPRSGVIISKSCGGCPHCRKTSRAPYSGSLPRILGSGQYVGRQQSVQDSGFGAILVFYKASEYEELTIRRIVKWAGGRGIRQLVVTSSIRATVEPDLLVAADAGQWVFLHDITTFTPVLELPLPTMVIIPPGERITPRCGRLFTCRGDPASKPTCEHVLIAPVQMPDPERPTRTFRQTTDCPSFGMEEFLMRFGL